MNFNSYGWWMFAGVIIGIIWGYGVNQAPRTLHIVPSAIQMHGEP